MEDIRARAADRYLTWQDGARRARALRKQSPRKLGASPIFAALGALALGFGLAVAPPHSTEAQTLTVGARAKHSISPAQQAALDSFGGAPALTKARGVSVVRAFGPDDEDCIRADAELICRR